MPSTDSTGSQPELELTDSELLRYSRQIMMPELDIAGQLKLKNAKVLIVGLGGLGSPIALYLAAAGVGHLELVDFDLVEESNLQRQIAHTVDSLGMAKVDSAALAISRVNPNCRIVRHNCRVDAGMIEALLSGIDVVLDASDNFSTRFLINEAASKAEKVVVSGAAIRMEGQISVFDFRTSGNPCYSCLYQNVSDQEMTCSEAGVVAPLVGIIGSVQAMEAVKVITGVGVPLIGKLLILDAASMEWRTMKYRQDPQCVVCGELQQSPS